MRKRLCLSLLVSFVGVSACSDDTNGNDPDDPLAIGDPVDVDGDGTPDGVAVDADGDGVADSVDTDNDGIADTSLTGQSLRVYTIGGTVAGLTGSGLVLTNNGGDPVTVASGASSFTFSAAMAPGEAYDVAVDTQPTGPSQTCSIANGSGTVGSASVTTVSVTCATATYTVGGAVTGLAGYGLVITNNGGDALTLENGATTFTFVTPVADGSTYLVEVQTQPTGPAQTCTVSGGTGSGTVSGVNVTSVSVTCVTAAAYTVGGTITGLAGTGLVLTNNGGDALAVTNGASTFTFATPVANGSPYAVAVQTQPTGLSQNCTVDDGTGSGTVNGAHVTSVAITCTTVMFNIGGTISGLAGDGLVLTNNGGDDLTLDSGATTFTFATPIIDGGGYAVDVETDPTGLNQTCTIDSGTDSGSVDGAHVTTVAVTCVTDTFTVGGTITNLVGDGLVLTNGSDTTGPLNGGATSFVLPAVADGSSYDVNVQTNPTGPQQTCSFTGGSDTGTVDGANVDTVAVNCVTRLFAVRVTLEPGVLDDGQEIVLHNNGASDLTVDNSRQVWEFSTATPDGGSYDITVISSPTGLYCTVPGGSGTIDGGAVAQAISCEALAVAALYPTNGARWNDYVLNDGADVFSASGDECAGVASGGYTACIHGGERRVVDIPGEPDCTGLTATDTLGAFDWVCVDGGDSVAMISTGLKDGVNLSDLIDFAAPYVFWDNAVTVSRDGARWLETEPAVWWSNNVTQLNTAGTFGIESAIYLVNTNIAGTFTFGAAKMGLVINPGVTLTGSATADEEIVSAPSGARHLWIEGEIDATGDHRGVNLVSASFSVLRNVTVSNASDVGVSIGASYRSLLRNITVLNNGGTGLSTGGNGHTVHHVIAEGNEDGVSLGSDSSELSDIFAFANLETGVLIMGSGNRVTDVAAANNGRQGLLLSSCDGAYVRGVVAVNNEWDGVEAQNNSIGNTLEAVITANNAFNGLLVRGSSHANRLLDVVAANNANGGVRVEGGSNNNLFAAVTVANNVLDGLHLTGIDGTVLSAVVTANNGGDGLDLTGASAGLIENIVSAHNGGYGISLASASAGNRFTGMLGVGNNDGGGVGHNCYVDAESTSGDLGDDPSWVDVTHLGMCGQKGLSDFAVLINGTVADSFVGKITSDDTTNESDSIDSAPGQSRTWPTDPNDFDWTQYDNRYRAWGYGIDDFPDPDQRRRWTGGTGHIWDWRLWEADVVIQDSVPLPGSGDHGNILTFTWTLASTPTQQGDCDTAVPGSVFVDDHCENTFLRAAIELVGDGVGNDNGLCETDETCLATRNFGAYQGHGSFDGGTAIDGAIVTGVVRVEYGETGVSP